MWLWDILIVTDEDLKYHLEAREVEYDVRLAIGDRPGSAEIHFP